MKSYEIIPFPNTKMMRNLLCVHVSNVFKEKHKFLQFQGDVLFLCLLLFLERPAPHSQGVLLVLKSSVSSYINFKHRHSLVRIKSLICKMFS